MNKKLIIVLIVTIIVGQSMAMSTFGQSRSTEPQISADDFQADAADDAKTRNFPPKNALAGSWDVILTFGDGSNVRSTLQIMAGPAEGEGAAIHASEFSLVPPNPTLPEQGSWRFVRGKQFVASYYGYSFDEQLQPFGKIGFKHLITISSDQDHFTGQAVFEVLDLDGNVLFSDNVTTAGVRQRAVAP